MEEIEAQVIENKTGLKELRLRLLALEELLAREGVIVRQDIEVKEREIISKIKNNKNSTD